MSYEAAMSPSLPDRGDQLAFRFRLPLSATLHPMGFPLELRTNAEDVLIAATDLWSSYPQLSAVEPVRLSVAVNGVPENALLNPTLRGYEHLFCIVQSSGNFAVADLTRGSAYVLLTPEMAANREQFRYRFLEPLVYLMIDSLHTVPLHASCVALESGAVVLCGDSGAGKTSLAYACARNGWTYLSDDATHILRRRDDYLVAGRPNRIRFRESARKLFPELAGYPPACRPNGKWDIEVASKRLGLRTAYRAEARAIIFLNRTEASLCSLAPFSRTEAREILEGVICYGDERSRAEQITALHCFLNLPVFQLTYKDGDQAEKELRRLLA